MPRSQDDTMLSAQLRSSDFEEREAAFVHMVDLYSQRLYWTVRKVVVSHHDADDVIQNVFLKAWNSLSSFRGDSTLYTWLYRIAVNESLSLLRSRRRTLFRSYEDSGSLFDRIVSDEGLFDGDSIERSLARAVAQLPGRQRAVFTLRYWESMPYEEMSAILGSSVGSLKASYHHAATKVERWVRQDLSGSHFRVEDPVSSSSSLEPPDRPL